jgi:uncharacterized protein YkwD
MRDIKNAPQHFANIMNEQFTEVGIGVARGKSGKWYMCHLFAAPKK